MSNIRRSRLAILTASISAALALGACQPASEEVATTTNDSAQQTSVANSAIDPHADHDMGGADKATTPNTAAMTPILQEYTDAMTQMHSEMMTGMAYNDPDSAFAQGMLGHHLGAVAMAEIELKYGTDAKMQALAQQIIEAQKKEITQMQKWLESHPDVAAPMADTGAMQQAYAMSVNTMHDEMMLGITDPIADMAFARGMLPHHKGAVAMAQVQLQYGKDPEMRQLAQEIIAAQQPQIEQMQDWIRANGGTVPTTG